MLLTLILIISSNETVLRKFEGFITVSFYEMIKIRGNNAILALKLHILLFILMKSIHISLKPL